MRVDKNTCSKETGVKNTMVRRNKKRQMAAGAFSVLLLLLSWQTTVLGVTQYDCENNVHAYEVTIEKEAAETEDGVRRYSCVLCGDTYEEVIPMYGHVFGEWVEETEATCQTPGQRYRVCIQHEHETQVRETEAIAVSDHQYEVQEQEATCSEAGQITYTCIWCGDIYTEETAATGHQFGAWIVAEEATASAEGYRYRVCANDPTHIEEEVIPPLSTPINTADVLLTGANISVAWVFGVSIARDCSVLVWHNRKMKAFLKLKNAKGGLRP